MKNLFYGCSSLTIIPDISKWKIRTYPDFVEKIFFGCPSSIIKPDITKWQFYDHDPVYHKKRDISKNLAKILEDENDTERQSSYVSNIIKENLGSSISIGISSNISNLNEISDSNTNEEINNIIFEKSEFSQQNNELEDYYENFYRI